MADHSPHRVLLTGASGYVGGRLLPVLLEQGHAVRCMARQPELLSSRYGERVDVVAGDVLDPDSLHDALAGIDTAYYLIHSMGSAGGFEQDDRRAAENFAKAAREAGVSRIIYLGGLGSGPSLSAHLASRQEVGEILRESGVPTLEFRASIIIGSGSLSFEMIRALVQRLPVMTTPRWVRSLTQPIAIEDVIAYLTEAIEKPHADSIIYEIGGPDRMSYCDLMREYARQRGLRRFIIPVPLLSPGLSSLWLGLVTPLYARVGRKLIDSVRHSTVVNDQRALKDFNVKPRGVTEAMERALVREDQEYAQTRWSDATSSGGDPKSEHPRLRRRVIDSRKVHVPIAPKDAFDPIQRIGGKTGWYYGTWLWRLRAFIDLLFGGVGMRRGRSHPVNLHPGEALDFWRVESVEAPNLLRLRAEMKVPGRAWLQFEVEEDTKLGGAIIRQTAIFDPVGLFGIAYWYALWPLHQFVFSGMLRGIANAAMKRQPGINESGDPASAL